ncbi:MAG: hypothetical protein A2008_12380 [Candidatus Wallbacteria bacterium GWC2_49_35]|uniref:DUF4055 domain-containing protein n=1 Tax=Candidatus Wallbacteria bacterium GWC2_49_35 TaxID=1817813 RepID=A0A1F7X0D1_9BACT|nr:MAG: hypothetical protein A2008_12380 [Candidatus Wallbacteria bacterium GWC2_49_35]
MASNAINALTISKYTLWKDAYYGTGGFETGYYLTQHSRESETKYNKRREIAYYLNYVAPTTNAHVDPIFRKNIKREYNDNEIFKQFLSDADANGTPFEYFMKYAAINSKLNGITFIVVDNVTAQPSSLADVLKGRALPYVYLVEPSAVIDYKITSHGRLTYFSYLEPDPVTPCAYQIKTWTENLWSVEGDTEKSFRTGENTLGVIPIVAFKSRITSANDLFPPSEFSSIVKTNLSVYNKCSWSDEILLNQTFAVLTYPASESSKTLVLGPNNVLGFDGVSSKFAPSFIAPPADSAQTLMNDRANLIQEIYRMANLSLVTGVKTAQSGVSKEWDNEAKSDVLANFAGNTEMAERKVISFFEMWSQQNIDYKCEYPRDFALPDAAAELDKALKAKDLDFGRLFNIEVAKNVISVLFPKLQQEDTDAIIDEMKEKAEDAANASPANNLTIEQMRDIITSSLPALAPEEIDAVMKRMSSMMDDNSDQQE